MQLPRRGRATCASPSAARDATEALRRRAARACRACACSASPTRRWWRSRFDDVDAFAVGDGARRGAAGSSISRSRRRACTAPSTRCTAPVIPRVPRRARATRWPRCGARAPGAPRSGPTARSSERFPARRREWHSAPPCGPRSCSHWCFSSAPPPGARSSGCRPGGDDTATGTSTATAWATLEHAADAGQSRRHGARARRQLPGLLPQPLRHGGQPDHLRRRRHRRRRSPPTTARRPTASTSKDAVARRASTASSSNDRTRAGIRVARLASSSPCATATPATTAAGASSAASPTTSPSRTTRRTTRIAEHGIYVSNSGDRPIIRGNLVHDNHANGIHMNGDAQPGRRRH